MEPYLAAPADLAPLLGIGADDPRLLAALAAATRRFRGQVRHPVTRATSTIDLDGSGGDVLQLPAAPVVAVGQVLVDGDPATGWRVRYAAGLLQRPGGCWPEWSRITVTYTHGHETAPDDVAEAVVDLARVLYRADPAIQQITTGSESLSYNSSVVTGATSQWTAAVEHHRLNLGDSA
ncbi:mobile element protein [Streptomyces bohaiensis]|uniref:Mobile element protein n=1 Tax=Streptomyces bohaiensis TaxID=1431344 RepID=A0ABX1C4U5_9ACTN|nr:mobile element protein [Streptomyces bohaiensis]NJQ14222.1 mobile element protein [Streptomyces bohaiensis]